MSSATRCRTFGLATKGGDDGTVPIPEQLRPYLELGFTHLVFHHPGDDQSRFLNLYANQILPRLRKWGGR